MIRRSHLTPSWFWSLLWLPMHCAVLYNMQAPEQVDLTLLKMFSKNKVVTLSNYIPLKNKLITYKFTTYLKKDVDLSTSSSMNNRTNCETCLNLSHTILAVSWLCTGHCTKLCCNYSGEKWLLTLPTPIGPLECAGEEMCACHDRWAGSLPLCILRRWHSRAMLASFFCLMRLLLGGVCRLHLLKQQGII